MITAEKLQIFNRYKGDIDSFGRSGRQSEKQLLSDDEWYLVDTMIQDATVINRRLGSEQRAAQASERIRANCESQEVVDRIMLLARVKGNRRRGLVSQLIASNSYVNQSGQSWKIWVFLLLLIASSVLLLI